MFFVKDLEDRIELHPSYFNCDAARHIRERLYEKVEGTNTGSMMIIAVIKIDEVSEPKIAPGRGVALYDISYQAVVWRPFRGEVVDGLVSSVVTNGFFVDVCGLSVFVSRAMIPSTMQYTVEGSTPNFSDSDGMTVERGSQVRLRIKGIRGEMGQMYAIGSIKEDYLGYNMKVPLQQSTLTNEPPGLCYSSRVLKHVHKVCMLDENHGESGYHRTSLCMICIHRMGSISAASEVRTIEECKNIQRYPNEIESELRSRGFSLLGQPSVTHLLAEAEAIMHIRSVQIVELGVFIRRVQYQRHLRTLS